MARGGRQARTERALKNSSSSSAPRSQRSLLFSYGSAAACAAKSSDERRPITADLVALVAMSSDPKKIVVAMLMSRHDVAGQRADCTALGEMAKDGKREAVIAAGGPAAVVAAMRHHVSDTEAQLSGLRALEQISQKYTHASNEQDSSALQAVIASGAAAAVLVAMGRHADSAMVQQRACMALSVCTKSSENATNHAAAVVAAMRQHTEDAQVQQCGCLALAHIAQKGDVVSKQAVATAGGATAILAAMKLHHANVQVQVNGATSLGRVDTKLEGINCKVALTAVLNVIERHTKNREAQTAGGQALQEIVLSNAMDPAVQAMASDVFTAVIKAASGAHLGGWQAINRLKEMACTNALTDQLAAAGGAVTVVSGMRDDIACRLTQEWGCQALAKFAAGGAAAKQAVVEARGLDAIVAALKQHAGVIGVLKAGRTALANMATGNTATTQAVLTAGGLAALVAAGSQHSTAVRALEKAKAEAEAAAKPAAEQELRAAICSADTARLATAIHAARQLSVDAALVKQAEAAKAAAEKKATAERELHAAIASVNATRLGTAIGAGRRHGVDAALVQQAEAAKATAEKVAAEQELLAAIISADATRLGNAIGVGRQHSADAALLQQAIVAEATAKAKAKATRRAKLTAQRKTRQLAWHVMALCVSVTCTCIASGNFICADVENVVSTSWSELFLSGAWYPQEHSVSTLKPLWLDHLLHGGREHLAPWCPDAVTVTDSVLLFVLTASYVALLSCFHLPGRMAFDARRGLAVCSAVLIVCAAASVGAMSAVWALFGALGLELGTAAAPVASFAIVLTCRAVAILASAVWALFGALGLKLVTAAARVASFASVFTCRAVAILAIPVTKALQIRADVAKRLKNEVAQLKQQKMKLKNDIQQQQKRRGSVAIWEDLATGVETGEKLRAFFERRQSHIDAAGNHQPSKLKIEAAIKVVNKRKLQAFAGASGFHINPLRAGKQHLDTLLFHGCHESVAPNIQATGLLTPGQAGVNFAHGSMLGNGIYGAPDPRKSAGYCNSARKFMFVCRFNLSGATRAGPDTPHRNTIFHEFLIKDDLHVAVLWMIKLA